MRKQIFTPVLFMLVFVLASLACTINSPAELPPVPSTATPGARPTTLPSLTLMARATLPSEFVMSGEIITITPTTVAATESHLCTVNTTALNVRSCAGLNCSVYAWLIDGDSVTIRALLNHPAGWLPVQVGGMSGWVKEEFCDTAQK